MTKQHGSAHAAVVAGRFVFMVEGLSVGRNLSRRRSSAQCDAKETAQVWRRGQRRPHRDHGGSPGFSPGLLPCAGGKRDGARSQSRKGAPVATPRAPGMVLRGELIATTAKPTISKSETPAWLSLGTPEMCAHTHRTEPIKCAR
jgi:hypothetical protein